MIDIHTHLVFDVDDGSSNLDTSIILIEEEKKQGVTDIICTPHYRKGMFESSKEKIIDHFNILKQNVKNINLYLGQEVYVHSYNSFKSILDNNQVFTMNNTQYLLLEFSYTREIDISEIVFLASLYNYKVIIAHIERYEYLNQHNILEIIQSGALIQMNASSVIGKYGLRIKKRCKQYLRQQFISFIASDIHSNRKNHLQKCYKYMKKHYDNQYVQDLFYYNAKILISGGNTNE